MSNIEKSTNIAAPIEQVWAALTDPTAIGDWIEDDSVEVDLKVGGRYQFFGRATTGAFIHIEPPHLLEYTWRQQEWPQVWPDSLVRWDLRAAPAGTEVRLTHSQFPNTEERDSHAEGWDIYFLEPMKEWLEENA